MIDGPPRFEPEDAESTEVRAPVDPKGAENTGYQPAPEQQMPVDPKGAENTGYQPVAPAQPIAQPAPPAKPAPEPTKPEGQMPPIRTVAPPPPRSEPLRGRPPVGGDDEEVIEVSGAPLLLGIGAILVAILSLLIALGIINVGQNSGLISSDRLAAGSVGQTQLANGAVDLEKISENTITDLQGRTGPAGPAGEKGPAGPAGQGLKGLNLVSKQASGDLSASVTAACAPSQIAISGGALIDAPSGKVVLTSSAPTSTEEGWIARASAVSQKPGAWTLTAYAWCTKDPR